jgi:hypothetical protein
MCDLVHTPSPDPVQANDLIRIYRGPFSSGTKGSQTLMIRPVPSPRSVETVAERGHPGGRLWDQSDHSLSAILPRCDGWSGPRFFGLTKRARAVAGAKTGR